MAGQMYLQSAMDDDHETGGLRTLTRGNRHGLKAERCDGPDLGLLVEAVETEVIPRLLSVHKREMRSERLPTMGDVEQLATHALESDTAAAHRLISTLRAEGVGVEAIYLNLLGATARMLGEMWEQDRVNFIDVTVGLCTLHQILFRLAPEAESEAAPEFARRALFVPVPGETHVFGTLIVARFFSRAGWRTWTELSADEALLSGLLAHHSFDLVGLSISCERHMETLAETVRLIRSRAPGARIMIGGHMVETRPDLAEEVGADIGIRSAPSAVSLAESLIDKAGNRV